MATEGPQTAVWGPALWGILHMLAEKSGRGTGLPQRWMGPRPPLSHADERGAWARLFSSLRTTLPCPLCKQHYVEYLRTDPPERILRLDGPAWAEELRQWLWRFHNAVRVRKEQPTDFPYSSIAMTYIPDRSRFQGWEIIMREHMRRGMFLRWLIREDMLRTIQTIEQLWLITL
jgi:hypothetical protein